MSSSNVKCPHLKDRRSRKLKKIPSITLLVAGAEQGITLCPECYKGITQGKKVKVQMSSRNNKWYKVAKARESHDRPFMELRTELTQDG